MGRSASALVATRDGWKQRVPRAVFSGIAPASSSAYGFHNSANGLIAAGKRSDYSLREAGNRPGDGIDMDAYDALDMSMVREDMIRVTNLIYNSWRDPIDLRLNWWYESIGTLDGSSVIYMDCQTGQRGTADQSHLSHVHNGIQRIHANNLYAAHAMLSIIGGGSWQQYMAEQPGDPFVVKARNGGPAPAPRPTPTPTPAPSGRPAPGPGYAFPLPAGYYFGPKSGPTQSISGYYGETFNGRTARVWLQEWANQLGRRGWSVGNGKQWLGRYGNDGYFGDEYDALARAFQADQRLSPVDGLIGPDTWWAAYHRPVT